ncbi:MAG: GNAT family N-acetyltransferase [Pseudomonadales bacterium]|nr:GNAT family N-acetyltransferase [Pseudomonadales bacterium]
MTKIRTELVQWQTHRDQLSQIRLTVFVEEQAVPIDEEWDQWDESSWHWLAYDESNHSVGTARLTPQGQIGRMAVVKEYRGEGVGAQLLESVVSEARIHFQTVFLHAQIRVIEFYQRAGFELMGPVFDEAGIAHQKMTLKY